MFRWDFSILSDHSLIQLAAAGGSVATGTASVLTASWSIDIFGVSVSVLLAGFAGALIALSFLPPYKTFKGMVAAVVAGTLIAAFTEPLIAHYSDAPAKLAQGIAFITGLVALSVIPLALRSVPEFFRALADRIRGNPWGGGGTGGGRDES
jgi:hypothetical protein